MSKAEIIEYLEKCGKRMTASKLAEVLPLNLQNVSQGLKRLSPCERRIYFIRSETIWKVIYRKGKAVKVRETEYWVEKE